MDEMAQTAGSLSDGELLERTRTGDREAFGELYERRRIRPRVSTEAHP